MSCRSWLEGDLAILIVFDVGYDVTRLAWLLAELLERLRSDRVIGWPRRRVGPGQTADP